MKLNGKKLLALPTSSQVLYEFFALVSSLNTVPVTYSTQVVVLACLFDKEIMLEHKIKHFREAKHKINRFSFFLR